MQNGRLVAVMADVLSDGEWVGTGIHSPTQWLAWKAGISPERTHVIARVAEKRAEFPVVTAALERGELTLEQAEVVVTKAPSWADSKVLDFVKEATVHQLRRTITDQFFDDGPPAAPAAAPPVDRLSFGARLGDRWRINGNFDIATGRRIEAALTEAKDSLFERGDTDATWADALVEISEASLDAVSSAPRRDRYRTWLHVDVSKGDATTTDGWRVPMAVRERLLCDGVVQPVWEREGVPFSVGRAQRIVPARTRRVVERRDRGCRVPGCTADRFVEVHHIVHWLHGGPSDTWNLISLCSRHHRQHHQGDVGVSGDADEPGGVVFTDVHGRVVGGSGRPKIPEADPDPPDDVLPRFGRADGLRLLHGLGVRRRTGQTSRQRPLTPHTSLRMHGHCAEGIEDPLARLTPEAPVDGSIRPPRTTHSPLGVEIAGRRNPRSSMMR